MEIVSEQHSPPLQTPHISAVCEVTIQLTASAYYSDHYHELSEFLGEQPDYGPPLLWRGLERRNGSLNGPEERRLPDLEHGAVGRQQKKKVTLKMSVLLCCRP